MEIVPSTFEETLDKSKFARPSDYVLENARQKGLEVASRLKDSPADLLICKHYQLQVTPIVAFFANKSLYIVAKS